MIVTLKNFASCYAYEGFDWRFVIVGRGDSKNSRQLILKIISQAASLYKMVYLFIFISQKYKTYMYMTYT